MEEREDKIEGGCKKRRMECWRYTGEKKDRQRRGNADTEDKDGVYQIGRRERKGKMLRIECREERQEEEKDGV